MSRIKLGFVCYGIGLVGLLIGDWMVIVFAVILLVIVVPAIYRGWQLLTKK